MINIENLLGNLHKILHLVQKLRMDVHIHEQVIMTQMLRHMTEAVNIKGVQTQTQIIITH